MIQREPERMDDSFVAPCFIFGTLFLHAYINYITWIQNDSEMTVGCGISHKNKYIYVQYN
jgi:hypothetical protein